MHEVDPARPMRHARRLGAPPAQRAERPASPCSHPRVCVSMALQREQHAQRPLLADGAVCRQAACQQRKQRAALLLDAHMLAMCVHGRKHNLRAS